MKKLSAILMIFLIIFLVAFGTWQLFLGNLEAAFATFPFLLIIYFFLKPLRN